MPHAVDWAEAEASDDGKEISAQKTAKDIDDHKTKDSATTERYVSAESGNPHRGETKETLGDGKVISIVKCSDRKMLHLRKTLWRGGILVRYISAFCE
jgi:hypothetical protein